eukprot:36120_1
MYNIDTSANTCYTPPSRTPTSLLQSQTNHCGNHETTANISLIASTYYDSEPENTTPTPSVSCISPPSVPPSPFTPKSPSQNKEDELLRQNGYEIVQKLSDTQQGQLFEAYCSKGKRAIIKKVHASLHARHIGIAHQDDDTDGMTFCIPNDILKESLILSHLTAVNRQSQIIKFVDFFYSKQAYYLVLEHLSGNCMNLKQFAEQAHVYIHDGQLAMDKYLQVIKWIFWQLFVLIRWMHNDMHCCHLDLKLEHVMLKGATFMIDADTSLITISRRIGVKLCDFASAELFEDGVFKCDKKCSILREAQYQSPLLGDRQTYDARKADIWALGSMLFHCLTGQPIYRKLEECKQIERTICDCVKGNRLKRCGDLIAHVLRIDEDERYSSMDVLKHQWFKVYYRKYKDQIAAKSQSQKKRLNRLKQFPYYMMDANQIL